MRVALQAGWRRYFSWSILDFFARMFRSVANRQFKSGASLERASCVLYLAYWSVKTWSVICAIMCSASATVLPPEIPKTSTVLSWIFSSSSRTRGSPCARGYFVTHNPYCPSPVTGIFFAGWKKVSPNKMRFHPVMCQSSPAGILQGRAAY